jgi:hypothetical protein
LPDERDFLVEYCADADPALAAWCVLHEGLVVFFDPVQERAIAAALPMATDDGSAAWLIMGGRKIRIPGSI